MEIEKGTIKVVWVSKNLNKIHSKMFENIKDAEKFGKSKKDYIIFKLIKQKNFETFEWEILPYGKYKTYLAIVKGYQKYEKLF